MKTAKTKKEDIDTPREVKTGARPAKVELISYSIKMTIPTGQYANIIPEIVVKAGTVEQAHDYIAPHFNKLWKEYYLCGERRPETVKPAYDTRVAGGSVKPTTPSDFKPMTDKEMVDKLNEKKVTPEQIMSTPVSSVAFTKASQAISSCTGHKALESIKNQIAISTKLTPEDKEKLQPLIVARIASGQLTE